MRMTKLLKQSILELASYQKKMNLIMEQKYVARSALSNDEIRTRVLCQEKMDECYAIIAGMAEQIAPARFKQRTSRNPVPSNRGIKRPPWDNR